MPAKVVLTTAASFSDLTRKGDIAIDLTDKSVFISGGTGSLGNALTARLLASPKPPRRLIIFSRDELKQHEMALRFPDPRLRMMLGDVRDRDRLYRAFDGVDYVIHAAALKQVPAAEYSPLEAIKTNVMGAANVIDAAIDRNVSRVIAISTDKATNPVNLYGATKLCAEKLFVAANAYVGLHTTRFAALRYGNVANSRGSVIPLWQQHVSGCIATRCTGIKITDTRMTRFFISLDQAVTFVLNRLSGMRGGEVFIPKLPSTRITDLAAAVAPDCRVEVTGIRPGEKLAELMVSPDELRIDCGDYYIVGYGATGPAYASNTNDQWLSVEEIREQLK